MESSASGLTGHCAKTRAATRPAEAGSRRKAAALHERIEETIEDKTGRKPAIVAGGIDFSSRSSEKTPGNLGRGKNSLCAGGLARRPDNPADTDLVRRAGSPHRLDPPGFAERAVKRCA